MPEYRPAFAATLTPHRSLDRNGFIAVMTLVIVANLVVGVVFFVAGAWPVTGFMGLDVLLIWWAFRINFADARRMERVEVTDRELIFSRHAEGKASEERRFQRPWVRVELEEDRERELVGRMTLRGRSEVLEFGRFLAAEEKQSFAHALRAALAVKAV